MLNINAYRLHGTQCEDGFFALLYRMNSRQLLLWGSTLKATLSKMKKANGQQSKRQGKRVQVSEIASLVNSIQQLSIMAAKNNGNAKPSKVRRRARRNRGDVVQASSGGVQRTGGAYAAVRTTLAFVGVKDLVNHCASYTMGYIFVGDGTNGTANAVLFQSSDKTLINGQQTAAPIIPILPSDGRLGKSYITDISKHFQRRKYRKLLLHVDSLQPNTNAAMIVVVAPVRGGASAGPTIPTVLATAGATAATLDSVRSMKGNLYLNSFETGLKRTTLDLTPFIAGGSGPLQNEFPINNTDFSNSTCYSAAAVMSTLCVPANNAPACIIVTGLNTIAGNQNNQMFELIIEMEYDLLDFTGGEACPNPIG